MSRTFNAYETGQTGRKTFLLIGTIPQRTLCIGHIRIQNCYLGADRSSHRFNSRELARCKKSSLNVRIAVRKYRKLSSASTVALTWLKARDSGCQNRITEESLKVSSNQRVSAPVPRLRRLHSSNPPMRVTNKLYHHPLQSGD